MSLLGEVLTYYAKVKCQTKKDKYYVISRYVESNKGELIKIENRMVVAGG